MSKSHRVVAFAVLCDRSGTPYWYMENGNITCIHVNVDIKGAPTCGDTTFVYVQGDHRYVREGDMLVLENTDNSTGTMLTKQYKFWEIIKQDD